MQSPRCRMMTIGVMSLLIAVLSACGNDNQAEETPVPALSAEEILSQASQRLADTQTVHFNLDVEGSTYIDDGHNIQLVAAEGALVRPDRVQTEFQVRLFGRGTVSMQLITVGDDSWTTDLLTGNWGSAPAEFSYDPTIIFDDQDGLGPVMDAVSDPTLIGDDRIRGRDAFHIRAEVEQEMIGPLTSNTMSGTPVMVEVWIDHENWDLLRAQLTEPPSPENDDPATWTLDISDHDRQITVDPPV